MKFTSQYNHKMFVSLRFLLYIVFRLWENVIAIQRDTVPGRDHFLHRMRTTVSLVL